MFVVSCKAEDQNLKHEGAVKNQCRQSGLHQRQFPARNSPSVFSEGQNESPGLNYRWLLKSQGNQWIWVRQPLPLNVEGHGETQRKELILVGQRI